MDPYLMFMNPHIQTFKSFFKSLVLDQGTHAESFIYLEVQAILLIWSSN